MDECDRGASETEGSRPRLRGGSPHTYVVRSVGAPDPSRAVAVLPLLGLGRAGEAAPARNSGPAASAAPEHEQSERADD